MTENPIEEGAKRLGIVGGRGDTNYISIAEDYSSLFISTKRAGDAKGMEALQSVFRAFNFSTPLQRYIFSTNSNSGTKTWFENGMQMAWHYHPELGTNLAILLDRDH